MHPAVAAALFALTLYPSTVVRAQDSTSDAAIRAIIVEQVVAWNAGDGTRYARHVAPDVSFTNLFGMVMYGAPAFASRHSEILGSFYKGTRKQHVIRRIRFVTPDVAIVDIDNEVHGVTRMPGGIVVPADGIVKTQLMEVFARRAGQWWVEAYHNVDVKGNTSPSSR
ncbi:MAG: SgcJ/EcaC family oxidoreductase [Gemmatimonadaceae bacterium]|nr:SgcJ/EcaC family oxidoreductase [Gemmatimonadaceae bacterium]